MRYGHFDDARKEYVITRPDTPRSWSNYLGNTEYGAVITNNAGGYSFYKSSALGRFIRMRFNSVPMDQPGRYLYLRDRDSGDYWSASWQPCGKPLSEYKTVCRHGTAYTVIESAYKGIRSETTYFVPVGRAMELWMLKLTNTSRKTRRLRLFTYVEYATNWSERQDQVNLQFSQYNIKMDVEDGIAQAASIDNVPTKPDDFKDNDQGHHSFLAVAGAKVTGFETDREAFLGPYRTYANPIAVEKGRCTGSLAYGDNGCGVLQFDVTLKPGQSREVRVVVGIGKAAAEGAKARREFEDAGAAHRELATLKDYWHSRLGALVVRTPDADFNSMTNVWGAYNALITFAWSRMASLVYSGERDGLGYRDTVQDLNGVMSMIAEEARPRLEMMLMGQFSTGGAKSIVQPFAHRPGHEKRPADEMRYRSDDCLWLFNSVPSYVKETGDLAFYDKVLPYADAGEATVLGHLRRAIEFNLARMGAHGLPCGLEADWNDCLRLGLRGESLFVAFQLRIALMTYADICRRLGRDGESAWTQPHLAALDGNLRKHAWDGKWFVRAFCEDGTPIGSHTCKEGSIFLNAQSWAIISGFASGEMAGTAMKSVKQRLATDYGIAICAPPFRHTPYHVVRAVLINEGQKENAGLFSQIQPWAVMAEALLGHGDQAYDYYRRFMPAAYNDRAELRQIEPYVHCQSTHSRFSRRYGNSRIPWLTGTASWAYVAATQYLLGIQPEYDGLRVDPCLPRAWKEIEVDRTFRGRRFHIRIRNGRKGKGVKSLLLNGHPVEGTLIPLGAAGESNEVVVTLA